MIHWTTVNSNATAFYKRYCKGRRTTTTSVSENAADFSYRASMNMRDPSHIVWGRTPYSIRQSLKGQMAMIISVFLSKEDFSAGKCLSLMTEIRNFYHSNHITSYTYGMAQKWVTMAIKYYVILNSYDASSGTCDVEKYLLGKGYSTKTPLVFDYHFFPVDTSFSIKLIRLIGVDFKGTYSGGLSWHLCDDIQAFRNYWSAVEATLSSSDDLPPFVYEIEHF